ncbi:PilN domain-containing protein [Paraburkholderia azotifigens]|uniref:PilN domain-containing protein n=2 Tax=Paraburkholderia azotifigens TaxID=2057004 RepID=A0A5C6V0L4_9BURK|nr:PilN domain-containing protein [Paraburkholderia azotifigens]
MKRLPLDLAPLTMRREFHRVRPLARMLALLGLVLCALAGLRIHERLLRLDSLDREGERLAARAERAARASTSVRSEPIDMKQGVAVNAAVARLNLPWDALLDAIEAATPSQVALLSITPEPGRALIKIEAECSDSKGMIDYLASLGRQPLFGAVNLVKHELSKDGQDSVIRFGIEVHWRGITW